MENTFKSLLNTTETGQPRCVPTTTKTRDVCVEGCLIAVNILVIKGLKLLGAHTVIATTDCVCKYPMYRMAMKFSLIH